MHLKDVRPQTEIDEPLGDRKVLEDYVRGPFVVVPLGEGCMDVAGLVDAVVEDARGFVVALEPTAKGAANAAWLTHRSRSSQTTGSRTTQRPPSDKRDADLGRGEPRARVGA